MGKMKLQIEGFDLILRGLQAVNADRKEIAEKALTATFDVVQEKVKAAMRESNLPARGKYDSGLTRDAIIERPDIKWQGEVASVGTGFDLDEKKGFISIYLKKGTPKFKPVKGLEAATHSAKTDKEVREAQEKVFYEEIARLKSQ